ncbi:hypothetical protein Tco_0550413, partial [Tanacetum coccineum]
LSGINDDLFTYETEVPKPTPCIEQQTSDPKNNDIGNYEWKMSYEECKKIYADAVIFIDKRLIRLIDVTVEQWLDLKYGDHKAMDKNIKNGVIDYENELNNELDEPWSEDGVPYKICDHIYEPFRFKNGKTKWPTCNSNEDGFCNGVELPGMVRVGYMTYFQDHEWYDDLMDGCLKDEALMQKAIYGKSWGDATQNVINFFFQIPIAPADQEKTTFTCPYGTFAYRRMPFGLCNAPATFQRCMTTIFHNMVEDFMEVYQAEDSRICKHDAKRRLIRWILLLQGFDIEIKDKKGAENLAAYHLSRLENLDLGVFTEADIADDFPDEHLMILKAKLNDDEPWYADYVNYIVGKIVPPTWTPERRIRTYIQDCWWKVNDHECSPFTNWRDHIRGPYANYYSNVQDEEEQEDKERYELFNDTAQEPPVYKIIRYEMIKYSFGQEEEYVSTKEYEYDDLT